MNKTSAETFPDYLGLGAAPIPVEISGFLMLFIRLPNAFHSGLEMLLLMSPEALLNALSFSVLRP